MSSAFTYTFGAGGMYTGSWDGSDTLTVTLTATGAFVESFSGQSLQALLPLVQQGLTGVPSAPRGPMTLWQDTGNAGFALTSGTPVILTWTAPADGQLHSAVITGMVDVSSATTGGELATTVTSFPGSPRAYAGQFCLPSLGVGVYPGSGNNSSTPTTLPVPSGGTVTLSQFTGLTAGAAKAYAQLWVS